MRRTQTVVPPGTLVPLDVASELSGLATREILSRMLAGTVRWLRIKRTIYVDLAQLDASPENGGDHP